MKIPRILLIALIAWLPGEASAVPTYITLARTIFTTPAVNGLPVAAATEFYCGWDATDPLQVVEHELLHAIGFATHYDRFADSLRQDRTLFVASNARYDDVRVDVLDSSLYGGLHLDPAGIGRVKPHGEHNEVYLNSADMMVPALTAGKSLTELDKAMLDAVYNWSDLGLNISVNFETWSGSTAPVTTGADAVTTLFGGPSGDQAHAFVWTVRFVAPEPGMRALFALALAALLVSRQRPGAHGGSR